MTDKRDPLSAIAPYPRSAEEATAGALIKHYAAFGEMHSHLAQAFRGEQDRQSIGHVVSSFTAVYLLTEIRDRLGEHAANGVTRELWESWEAGALPPWLWEWADEEGLDHDAIAAAAREVEQNIRAKAASDDGAIARVRALHSPTSYDPAVCCCGNSLPCPTIRALDGDTGAASTSPKHEPDPAAVDELAERLFSYGYVEARAIARMVLAAGLARKAHQEGGS